MFKQRALTALVFVPWSDHGLFRGVPFDLFWSAVLAFAGFEFARMARVLTSRFLLFGNWTDPLVS